MEIVNITEARSKLYALVDKAGEENQPILIKGKRHNAMLISEADWSAINETLYLTSIAGMRDSILEAGQEAPEDCTRASPL